MISPLWFSTKISAPSASPSYPRQFHQLPKPVPVLIQEIRFHKFQPGDRFAELQRSQSCGREPRRRNVIRDRGAYPIECLRKSGEHLNDPIIIRTARSNRSSRSTAALSSKRCRATRFNVRFKSSRSLNENSFKTFKPFNRFAPFNALRRFKSSNVQDSK